jgi:predicted DCC family thiol-disulfide oxidoreductase YuxK
MRQWHLVYDDNCNICNLGVEKVKKLDKTKLIKLVPLSNPRVPPDINLPSPEKMQKQMYLFGPDGEIFKGADALARMMTIFPDSKLLGKIVSFPLFRPLARLIYAIVAKHRMKLSKLIS